MWLLWFRHIGAKRSRIESERQHNIDLVIKRIIGEDDARGRVAELKAQRLQVEAELAALEEAPPSSRCTLPR